MSVKVVRGLIGGSVTAPEVVNRAADVHKTPATAPTAVAIAAQRVASTDAVVTSIRSTKFSGGLQPERIREEREARGVAKSVAREIVGDRSATEVHGKLSGAAGARLKD